MAEAKVGSADGVWPAEIVHVNEDGWVLLNRGGEQGVAPGMRLLVVSDAARELRDVSASADDAARSLLRIRRTYELLEVVYAEEHCAVAIAARVPRERRPQIYRAPGGELLVWVPLPPQYTWPSPASASGAVGDDEDEDAAALDAHDLDDSTDDIDGAADEEQPEEADAESLAEQQEDDRWEQALPLNGLHVGDLVLPAIPVAATDTAGTALAEHQDTLFDAGRDYDWLGKQPS